MKRAVTTLTALGVMAWWPVNAKMDNTKMDNTITETNKSLAGVVLDEKSSEVDSTKVVSFEEEAKKLQKNKELVKAIMKNKRVKELVKIYWQKRVEWILQEWLSDEEKINDFIGLLSDEKVRKTLEIIADESIQELVEQYWWEDFGEILDNALARGFDIKLFEDLELQKALKEWDKEKVMKIINNKSNLDPEIKVFLYFAIAVWTFICLALYSVEAVENS